MSCAVENVQGVVAPAGTALLSSVPRGRRATMSLRARASWFSGICTMAIAGVGAR